MGCFNSQLELVLGEAFEVSKLEAKMNSKSNIGFFVDASTTCLQSLRDSFVPTQIRSPKNKYWRNHNLSIMHKGLKRVSRKNSLSGCFFVAVPNFFV